ncbi:LacI family DNA-binding transcriptional regulator [Paenarthrobacter sp. NPDC089714]|uniref:LacI family DNA-binding transcriptional regulator n=1 Tax=Paenarthrobacter sp. NPDC089714 TaxID=3364377 RepID=UPI003806414B
MEKVKVRPRRITMKDVARRAGVSVPTVSKVLHEQENVKAETVMRVREAFQELGYVPVGRPEAPSLTSIIMAFDTFGHDYGSTVLTGALDEASSLGLRTVLDYAPGLARAESAAEWVERQVALGSRAAVLIATRVTHELVEAARMQGLALVAIDPKNAPDVGVVTVGSTSWAGVTVATNHLLELGHQRIAFAGYDDSVEYSVERFSAYRSAMERAGLSVRPEYVGQSDVSSLEKFEDSRKLGIKLARLDEPPTAVVCFCDAVAFGVIEGARGEGLNTPKDLSVVGFDDIPAARRFSPQLTTVRQPLVEMGAQAVRTAINMVDGQPPATAHLQLSTTFEMRGSTASPG